MYSGVYSGSLHQALDVVKVRASSLTLELLALNPGVLAIVPPFSSAQIAGAHTLSSGIKIPVAPRRDSPPVFRQPLQGDEIAFSFGVVVDRIGMDRALDHSYPERICLIGSRQRKLLG